MLNILEGFDYLAEPEHPASVAPGKRPRLTPSPGLVLRDGFVLQRSPATGDGAVPRQCDRLWFRPATLYIDTSFEGVGSVCAVLADRKTGGLHGAADSRRVVYAAGW